MAKTATSGTSANRQMKVMNKLLFGKSKGKRGWYNTPSPGTFSQFSAKTLSNPVGVQKHTNRRITVLNKLFMKSITDLMATGAMAESITGLGIEISRVLVAPDFLNINVYWLAKGSEDDEAIDMLLRKCSGHLRHELSQLRVMGEVPRIHFVKDLEFARYVEVERILRSADKGSDEDHLHEDDGTLNGGGTHNQLPEMRHDVLGLNHSLIFSKIQERLKVTKVAWDQFKSSSPATDPSEGTTSSSSLADAWEVKRLQTIEREDRFAEFLRAKRQGKQRNAVNRADTQFLLDQHQGSSSNRDSEEFAELDEEYDSYDEDLYSRDVSSYKDEK